MPKDTVHSLFLSFGPIVEVNLHKRPSGIQHGSVQFEEAEDAAAAVDNMGGYDLFGKPLRVRLAKGDTEQFDNNKPCEYGSWIDYEMVVVVVEPLETRVVAPPKLSTLLVGSKWCHTANMKWNHVGVFNCVSKACQQRVFDAVATHSIEPPPTVHGVVHLVRQLTQHSIITPPTTISNYTTSPPHLLTQYGNKLINNAFCMFSASPRPRRARPSCPVG